ncbi:TetR/AcrR family transcriptional regulator [Bacillus sp. MRMR6]|uniref:TetR/AcrR family transcriptional regulator n=1 Tax=Bacillus sp. MRMR6 TaxID=1928617 RepID=UPI000950FF0B|nr:TetR/AcrR family transcriptional regulator [Bacillus sp. MRMR6]OLS40336.1 TetR family transcriptional regulator [Bacillus sp. MRMR6]
MKQKIMEASIQLFDQNGFKSTSIKDIVDSIGVTKGTFYYYFASKEELLKDIHLIYIEELLEQQENILSNPCTNCTYKLYEIVVTLIKNIRTKRQSARIFFREMRHLSEDNLDDIRIKRNEYRKNVEDLIQEGISRKEFKGEVRADILTFGILGMTNWSYYWYNHKGEVSEEQAAEIFLEMILNGIKSNSLH